MKTGIIGLPQVGKTSLFVMLTKQPVAQRSGNPREAHLGVTKVPDDRLDRLAALYNPKKLIHASVEYADVAALSQEALKETAFAANLRNVDALAHVVRAFEDRLDSSRRAVDPLRDIKNIDFDLIVNDLGQVEKRLERVEKDLKKMKTAETRKRTRAAEARQGASGNRTAAARDGDDARGQEARSRLHVPQREADSLRAQHRREHDAGQGPGRSGCEVRSDRSRRRVPTPERWPSAPRSRPNWPR